MLTWLLIPYFLSKATEIIISCSSSCLFLNPVAGDAALFLDIKRKGISGKEDDTCLQAPIFTGSS